MSSARRSPATCGLAALTLLAAALAGLLRRRRARRDAGRRRRPTPSRRSRRPSTPAPPPYAAPTRTPSPARSAGRPEFRDQQQTWFANLTQLPLQRLGYRFDPASLVRDGDAYCGHRRGHPPARGVRRRAGRQPRPAPLPRRRRRHPGPLPCSTAVRSRREPQPWDLGPIDVREGVGRAGRLRRRQPRRRAGAARRRSRPGSRACRRVVPYDWSGSVVVYALSDPTFLLSLDDVPGDDPERPRRAWRSRWGRAPGSRSTRGCSTEAGSERDRLVRHELTHVAVGDPRRRRTRCGCPRGWPSTSRCARSRPRTAGSPTAALDAAEAGVADLPDDASFNDEDSDAHYGLAWWAVEYVADAYGDDAPVAAPRRDGRAGRRPRRGAARPVRHQHRGAGRAGGAADPRALRPRRRATADGWFRGRDRRTLFWHELVPDEVDRAVHRRHGRPRSQATSRPVRHSTSWSSASASSSARASSCSPAPSRRPTPGPRWRSAS